MRTRETVLAAVLAGGSAVALAPYLPAVLTFGASLLVAGVGAWGFRKLRPSERPPVPLASISHEIRTPLNGILGLTQLLIKTASTTQQREYLESIRSSGHALLRLLSDILDYSTLRTGKLRFEPEPFRLRAWVRETARSFAPQAHLAGLELAVWVEPDVPDELVGDCGRLRQIVANLLVNAIKFTREGDVLLEISLAESTADRARLRFDVADTGVGIPAADRQSIFDAFQRGTTGDEPVSASGVGLGLSIAKDLVHRMGGVLELESKPGHGSRFYFTAWFEITPEGRLGDDTEPDPRVRDLDVLIVEDREVQRRVLASQMTAWGCRVTTAADEASALAALERERPFSLVLVDSHLPGVDTWKLLEAIQRPSPVPGVLMTLSHEHVDVDRLRAHGVLGHLTKPVASTHLLRAIEIILGGRSLGAAESVQTHQMNRLGLGGLRVLLAEDHPVNRTVVVSMLERAGSEVVSTTNGREALSVWRKEIFDIGILDVQMPEIDGLALARTIRAEEVESGKHLPLVALTANVGDADRERSREAGIDAFLPKPVQEEALVATMLRLVHLEPDAPDPVLDVPSALGRANGDQSLLAELVELFLMETPETMEAIQLALGLSDWRSVERLAHRLKGALLTLGASSAAESALALETCARERTDGACAAANQNLAAALEKLEPHLRAMAAIPESR